MKILIISISILLVLGGAIYAFAPKSESPTTTEVALLWDITDIQSAKPNADEVLALFDFSQKWSGAIFHFVDISDVSYTKESTFKIDPANSWLSNELDREGEITKFKSNVKNLLNSSQSDSKGKLNSSVYLPIANMLNHLAQSKAEKRILLVHSDLMENDTDISFYKKQFLLLTSNPDSVRRLFEKRMPLPRIDGIEIHFIYEPQNAEQDKQYQVVSNFYKSMLEAKGAKVSIGANI